MAEKITAEKRTEFGKGAARRIRREHKIPAVVYGHGNDPIHLSLPGHETMMALKHGGANALLELDIDGQAQLALAREVQVDPLRRVLEHIDFVAVRRGEKVTVDVPVHVDRRRRLRDAGGDRERHRRRWRPRRPTSRSTSRSPSQGAEVGTQIHASDLVLPEGTTLLVDPDTLIVNVTQQQTAEQLESELADAEADAGIVHEESDEAAEAGAAEGGSGDDADGEGAPEGDSAE